MCTIRNMIIRGGLIVLSLLLRVGSAHAHCDTLDGPVVQTAKAALQDGNVQPVLKWVKAEHENEIRDAFARTLKVRALGEEARELADLHFFETLVRLHRAAEGVGYTGLKPAGTIDPAVKAADEALARGSAQPLANHVGEMVSAELRKRFDNVTSAKAHADESVEAGRAYVAAYVEYVHFVEALHTLASSSPSEHHAMHRSAE